MPSTGRPAGAFRMTGQDGFEMSRVETAMTTIDTSLNRMKGNPDPRGGAPIPDGAIGESMTGEHDKTVSSACMPVNGDRIVNEIHESARDRAGRRGAGGDLHPQGKPGLIAAETEA